MILARHDIAKLVGTAIAVAALGLTTPGTAAADATDEAFLKKLLADAILYAGADVVIPRAHEVCEELGAGMSPASVHSEILVKSAFIPRQAAIFMADAVQAYCPGYADQFIS